MKPSLNGSGPMTQVVVLAKAPVPGRVKTRLCPPCTPVEAAAVAAAALADTLDAVTRCRAGRRILAVDGSYPAPTGWDVRAQGEGTLGQRLAAVFAAVPEAETLLIGMDTPQVTAGLLDAALDALATADVVFGPAFDGGWWLLGLRDARHAAVLAGIETSTPSTGEQTLAALRGRGLRVEILPALRDVDTVVDAHAVAGLCPPGRRFPQVVAEVLG